MAHQLAFELPSRPALGRGDFFVSPANAEALATVENWARWPQGKLALVGPAGSGKTHLTQVWAHASGARVIAAIALGAEFDPTTLATGPVAVEDADNIAGNRAAETALFHLHNLVLAEGHALLVTGRTPPASWPVALPDLASRLQACSLARLRPPDDALLAAVLVKLFADRQIDVAPPVIGYLTRRIDRSFDGAAAAVAALDRAALAAGRPITRPLAAMVLDNDLDGTA